MLKQRLLCCRVSKSGTAYVKDFAQWLRLNEYTPFGSYYYGIHLCDELVDTKCFKNQDQNH